MSDTSVIATFGGRTVADMSRTRIMLPIVVGLLALTACSSSPAASGSGALAQSSAGPATSATGPAQGQTTKPGTTSTTTSHPTTGHTNPPAPTWPTNAYCVSYNPNNLTVNGSGATGTFLIEDGSTIVIRVHGQSDDVGQEALALAQRYTRHCYLGRNNNMDPAGDFIFDYWRGLSGMRPTIPNQDDLCSPYNNRNLTVEDMGDGNGWRVKDHDHVLHVFANQSDANNGDLVLRKYSQVCAIGDTDDTDSDLGQVDFQI